MNNLPSKELIDFLQTPLGHRAFIEHLSNKFGDFKITRMTKTKEGDIFCSKHKLVSECNAENNDLLYTANNRQIFESEIVIDIDPAKDENPEVTLWKFNTTCQRLKNDKVNFRAYSTGSRGYHIHIICPFLLGMTNYNRTKFRDKFLKIYQYYDLAKNNNNVTIALEFSPHWKTGNPKKLIYDTTMGWDYELFK
jgi:hypothetical protein